MIREKSFHFRISSQSFIHRFRITTQYNNGISIIGRRQLPENDTQCRCPHIILKQGMSIFQEKNTPSCLFENIHGNLLRGNRAITDKLTPAPDSYHRAFQNPGRLEYFPEHSSHGSLPSSPIPGKQHVQRRNHIRIPVFLSLPDKIDIINITNQAVFQLFRSNHLIQCINRLTRIRLLRSVDVFHLN